MRVVSEESIRAFMARGEWVERTLVEDFDAAVKANPEREALVDPPNKAALIGLEPRRLTWAQLDRAVTHCALGLHEAGLKKDDIVVVQLPNIAEQCITYLACMRLGIVLTPVPMQFREHELEHVIKLTEAKAVITTTTFSGVDQVALYAQFGLPVHTLQQHAAWFDGEAHADRLTLATLEKTAGATAHDVVTVCWTSGTEGVPKGVPRNHNEWRIVATGVARSVGMKEGFRLLNPFPLTNLGGISGMFTPWLLLGGTLIQHHPFALPVFLEQLRSEKADYSIVPPALLNAMLQNEVMLTGIDFTRLNKIGSGSAPLSEWMVAGFAKKGVDIINYFGSNEGCTLMSVPADVPDTARRAVSFPRFGDSRFEWEHPLSRSLVARLVDPETNELVDEAGKPGELRIKGASVFAGYFRSPELNKNAFDAEGFFRTGDLFELTGERNEFFKFVGRSKDIIVRGGTKISSEELETLLMEHPTVADAAVIGFADERLGEKVCAVVVAKPNQTPTLEAIIEFLRDVKRIATYKLPERLEVIGALPRNPVGKILKRELRTRFAGQAGK